MSKKNFIYDAESRIRLGFNYYEIEFLKYKNLKKYF